MQLRYLTLFFVLLTVGLAYRLSPSGADPLELLDVECKSVEQVQHVIDHAAGCERAVMFVNLRWSLLALQQDRFSKLSSEYTRLHPEANVQFHVLDATPIDRGYKPLRGLPGWRALEGPTPRSLIHGMGEVVWMKDGEVLEVSRVFNYESVEALIARTNELLVEDGTE